MRLLLGGLFLLGLFAAATVWQKNWTHAVREERETLRIPPTTAPADKLEEWGRVIIGRPSGAEPVARTQAVVSENSSAPPAASSNDDLPQGATTAAKPARVFQLVIERGQTLSAICMSYYGSGRRELVQALAQYNQLRDADSVREGQVLLLPPLEKLSLTKP